jgi:hypothetical protein
MPASGFIYVFIHSWWCCFLIDRFKNDQKNRKAICRLIFFFKNFFAVEEEF